MHPRHFYHAAEVLTCGVPLHRHCEARNAAIIQGPPARSLPPLNCHAAKRRLAMTRDTTGQDFHRLVSHGRSLDRPPPPTLRDPIPVQRIKPGQGQRAQVGKPASAISHELLHGMARRRRQSEPDAGQRRHHHVRRVGQPVNNRASIGRILDHPGSTAEDVRMPRAREHLDQARSDVAHQRRAVARRHAYALAIPQPFVRAAP